jgi:hypothetical protein
MASTKEMQARAKLRKASKAHVHKLAQNAAKEHGYSGIDMTGSSSFMNSISRVLTNTPNNSNNRFDQMYRLFIEEARKHGGEQSAKDMTKILDEQRTILCKESA